MNTRTAVLLVLREQPGVSVAALARQVARHGSTVGGALDVMVRDREAWAIRLPGRLAVFPGPEPESRSRRLAALAATVDDLDRAILEALPGARVEVLDRVGSAWPRSTVEKRLYRLRSWGLVKGGRRGRSSRFTRGWQA